MIPGNANPLLLASAAAADAAAAGPIKSVRFNSGDSAYLNRTPSSAGNRQTWTLSAWIKKYNTNFVPLFSVEDSAGHSSIEFNSSKIKWNTFTSANGAFETDALFRDPSAWYHVVISYDSTLATAADRIKCYVNGVEQTFSSYTAPTQNQQTPVNNTVPHTISKTESASTYGDIGLTAVYLVDGSALGATSFGAFDANGVWQAAAYSGTFGTNGFHLFDFANESGIGNDSSGNDNDFTVNNISSTAGAGNDVLFDVPVDGNSSDDTGAGGEVSGNYCTLNPLLNPSSSTLSDGNLKITTSSSGYGKVNGTIGVSSGKFYWEVYIDSKPRDVIVGIETPEVSSINTYTGNSAGSIGWYHGGFIYENGGFTSYNGGATYGAGDYIGVALDMDAGTLVFYKNGVSQGTAKTGLSGTFLPSVCDGSSVAGGNVYILNFGQRVFEDAAPSNFKCLNTASLPTPTIADGSDYFDTKLWTGNGSTQTISGLEFSPDLVWIKSRSGAYSHLLFDQIRGTTKYLRSDNTGAEGTDSNSLTAFTSDGFSVGTTNAVNESGGSLVAWAWDAGSSTASNTDGDITSSVRANQTAGFSIVGYTGSGTAGDTIGHGLNAAPEMIIVKNRDSSSNWPVGHQSLDSSSPWTKNLYLNSSGALSTLTAIWNDTAPTSSVFTVGASSTTNSNGSDYIAYCFAPVAGYSAFGSYTGNNSADGPFVHLGFKPAFILIKCSSTAGSWLILDTARDTFNVARKGVAAQLNFAETGNEFDSLDIVSNGFKIRNTSASFNSFNSPTYIYAAFAENPFQVNGGLAR